LLERDDALLHSLLLQLLGVDAAAVVGDVDADLACFVVGPQVNGSDRRLARGDADVGQFDAVVD
jgi:hypothetical protein